DGTAIELVVDATSMEIGNGLWTGLMRSSDRHSLAEHPEVRFRSTRVDQSEDGTLHVEGDLETAGRIEPVAFDASVKTDDRGFRLEAVAPVDRQRLGLSGDRFDVFLPATLHVTAHFMPDGG